MPRIAIPISAVAAALALTVMSGDLTLGTLKWAPQSPVPAMAGVTLASSADANAPAQRGGTMRVATVTAETRARQAEAIRISNARRNEFTVEAGAQGGTGVFLSRVGSDRNGNQMLGPIRHSAADRDVASRILFMSGGTSSQPGPYLTFGASAAPSIALGSGNLLVRSPGLDGGLQNTSGLSQVAVTRVHPSVVSADEGLSNAEVRNRELDARLHFLKVDPPGFAERYAQSELAEQELWMRAMAERAEELGDVERVLSALKGSGDPEALGLARDFESAVMHHRETWAANEASQNAD